MNLFSYMLMAVSLAMIVLTIYQIRKREIVIALTCFSIATTAFIGIPTVSGADWSFFRNDVARLSGTIGTVGSGISSFFESLAVPIVIVLAVITVLIFIANLITDPDTRRPSAILVLLIMGYVLFILLLIVFWD